MALRSNLYSKLPNLTSLRDAILKSTFSNYDLFSKLLQTCIDQNSKRLGLSVHNQIETNGIQSTTYLTTKLVIFYCKIGRMVDARKVFDRMPERSVVSWTSLLSGYSQNGYPEEALAIFSSMHRHGHVKANQFTYGSALRACISLRCLKIGKQIQGCIQKDKLVDNLFVQSALIDLHSKCGKMEDASYIFGLISLSMRDLVSWNSMLGGYVVQGFPTEAFVLFRSMLLEGLIPDSFTLGSLIKASTTRGNDRTTRVGAGAIHVFVIKHGYESHNVISGSLIDSYAKCGDVRSAYRVHENMKRKDTVSTTALITGYAREGIFGEDSIALFREAHRRTHKGGVDNIMLCSMLNVCANMARIDLGRQVHALTLKSWSGGGDVAMGNALIDMYSKSGEIEDANEVFDEMEVKNVISWTSMIAACGKHGLGQRAVALFGRMETEGIRPNDVTFLSVMFACSHCGLSEEGWEYFNVMMGKYKIEPRAEHYSCMVDMFARGGRLEEVYGLLCDMKNVVPNASLWGAVLGACCRYGHMSMGEMAARRLFCMEPEKAVNYVVLGSIYAGAGLWDNVWKTRKLLELRSLRKDPGYSSTHYNRLATENGLILLPVR
ncbi:pentatricopeptide repeat-containing protein At3g20730 [Impatiens glandulifera]|uniref:pentatricopeptide repeat-containing protein At3g20730 n=1 Tax=Impatiens glandulifera TaxID=253017 RepID=UPI001FB14248|nr:pentatricopeptide repeat-containing protein At3g20730 [Impatiens glandulifera]